MRQILVQDEALANEIVRKLKQGQPFADLSQSHSVAANAKRGGEIGFVSRGELPKMFEEEIFSTSSSLSLSISIPFPQSMAISQILSFFSCFIWFISS